MVGDEDWLGGGWVGYFYCGLTMSFIQLIQQTTPLIAEVEDHLEEDNVLQQSQQLPPIENLNLSNSFLHDEGVPYLSQQLTQQTKQPLTQSMIASQLQEDLSESILAYFQSRGQGRADAAIEVTHRIKKQISNGEIAVGTKKRTFSLDKKEQEQIKLKEKEKEIEQRKWEAILKLKEVEQDELDLIRKAKSSKPSGRQMLKSILTPQDQERIQKFLKAKKQFDLEAEKRKERLIESAKQARQRQDLEKKLQHEQLNNKKKEQIMKRLQELQTKSKQREQLLKQSIVKHTHPYVYQKHEQIGKKLQREIQRQKEEKLQAIHLKHQMDIEQIKDHQRKYSLLLEERQSQSRRKHTAISLSLPKREKTHFDRLVEQEMFETKEKNYERIMKMKQHQFKDKVQKYQLKVLEEHRPTVDPAKSIIVVLPRTYSSVSLSKEDRQQKGLEYLQKAKQLKRSASEAGPPKVQPILAGYAQYKDYQKDRERPKIDPSLQSFKQIVRDKDEIQNYDSALKAKLLADSLSAKSKKTNDQKMYFSIQAKLSLLQGLT